MKVTLVTNHFSGAIRELFSRVSNDISLLPKNYMESPEVFETDLLVFAGGEDINPALYGSNYQTLYTDARDMWEWDALSSAEDGKIKAKKIFGICRGLQVLNVFHGGTLVTDIAERFGEEHEGVHPIMNVLSLKDIPNPFAEITMVNSLHHQAIGRMGRSTKVLAVEPKTKVPEIVTWGANELGMQFHPEFFGNDSKNKWRIAEIIAEWVDGKEFPQYDSKQPSSKWFVAAKEAAQALNEFSTATTTINWNAPNIAVNPTPDGIPTIEVDGWPEEDFIDDSESEEEE